MREVEGLLMKRMMILLACLGLMSLGHAADIAAGKAKAGLCIACHGADGNAQVTAWPKIAGLGTKYIIKQMHAFKKGDKGCRSNPSMTGIMTGLSDTDIDNLAAYFASQTMTEGKADPKMVARGEQLYRAGDQDMHITASIASHGPKGLGNAEAAFPRLSGQHAEYTALQLKAFKDKKRCNDANHIMRDIAAKMSDDDMKAVASYVQGLY